MPIADVVVVGGGPAGLTAAIYLARFHLQTLVVDDGRSRALMIPVSHNHAGHPAGIAGSELVSRMRAQALQYGAVVMEGCVTGISQADGVFEVSAGKPLRARAILLATGVRNLRPRMDDDLHDRAVATGRLRYCPICDGFEVTDKRIAVIGSGKHGAREALFLRSYSQDVALIAADGPHTLDSVSKLALEDAGIAAIDGPAADFALTGTGIELQTANGRLQFDSIYSGLGSDVHSGLAKTLGADLAEGGCIVVDSHKRTSIAGLYAAGDVVPGLDQISNAMGSGGIAATTIRNDLARISPLRR